MQIGTQGRRIKKNTGENEFYPGAGEGAADIKGEREAKIGTARRALGREGEKENSLFQKGGENATRGTPSGPTNRKEGGWGQGYRRGRGGGKKQSLPLWGGGARRTVVMEGEIRLNKVMKNDEEFWGGNRGKMNKRKKNCTPLPKGSAENVGTE